MRFQSVAQIATVMVGVVIGFSPLNARTAVDHSSAGKPRASAVHTARPQLQPVTPPIGYCMQCLPPPYEWPHGGAGP